MRETVLGLLVSDLAGLAIIEELRRFRTVQVVYAPVDRALAGAELVRQES